MTDHSLTWFTIIDFMNYHTLLCCWTLLLYDICACWWTATSCWYPTWMGFHFCISHPDGRPILETLRLWAMSELAGTVAGPSECRGASQWNAEDSMSLIVLISSISIVYFWHGYIMIHPLYTIFWRLVSWLSHEGFIFWGWFMAWHILTSCDIFCSLLVEDQQFQFDSQKYGIIPSPIHPYAYCWWINSKFLLRQWPEVLMK